jgi:hypothetical protein
MSDYAMNIFCVVMALMVAVFLGILTKGETWPLSVSSAFMAGSFFQRAYPRFPASMGQDHE